jgi:hypothetical protein
VALDDSSDASNTAQLLTHTHKFEITELLSMEAMKGMATGEDLYQRLSTALAWYYLL